MSILFVPNGLDNDRVDLAASRMSGYSRSQIAELIADGAICLNGQVVSKPSIKVYEGDILEITAQREPKKVKVTPNLAKDIKLVYQDRDIVVIDKPPAVAAHPSLGWDGPSVTEHLAAAGVTISTSGAAERQGVVQRLDVGTSGLMVLAKSDVAYAVLKQAFRDRTVDKTYHALVQGHPDPFEGTIDAPIARHPGSEWKMAVVAHGRASITHYHTLEAHRAASLLEIKLETGRTHQIRVHMAAIKHPCCADPLYGGDPNLAIKLCLTRQWLHAVRLGFIHPISGEKIEFSSDYPDDLQRALDIVRQD